MVSQWKNQMTHKAFEQFLEMLSSRLTENIKKEIQYAQFTLLGALYFDKIVRKLKNFY